MSAGTARRRAVSVFADHASRLNYVPARTQRALRDVAHVERSGADLRRGGRHRGCAAAGVSIDRHRRGVERLRSA